MAEVVAEEASGSPGKARSGRAHGLLGQSRRLLSSTKQRAFEYALSESLGLLARSEENYTRVVKVMNTFARNPNQQAVARWIDHYLAPDGPGRPFLRRLLVDVHPNVRRKYVARFLTSIIFHDDNMVHQLPNGREISVPATVVISPTMRCNLRCVGCYAGNYTMDDDLKPEEVERIIGEARDLGTRFFIVVGGEPMVYRSLFDILEQFDDCAFQFFTNGWLLNEQTIDRLVRMGNVVPAISVEGLEATTDARRGQGTFRRIMRTMDLLREARAFFAYSATASRDNVDEIVSDEFVDLMIAKGAGYGWYFSYCPVGRNPDVRYMPTPEQRNRLRAGVNRIRKTRPLLVSDFWNDGPLSEGCLAFGHRYLHINNRGDVEPCVFVHFATDNLRHTTLREALASDFFQAFRGAQPYGKNLLRPCPIIDRPRILRRAVEMYGARPTCEGAEAVVTELSGALDEYARDLRKVYEPVWREEYGWTGVLYGDKYKVRQPGAEVEEDVEVHAGCPLCR